MKQFHALPHRSFMLAHWIKKWLMLLALGTISFYSTQLEKPTPSSEKLPPSLLPKTLQWIKESDFIEKYKSLPVTSKKKFDKKAMQLLDPFYFYIFSLCLIGVGSFLGTYSSQNYLSSFSIIGSLLVMSAGILLYAENFDYPFYRTFLYLLLGWILPFNIYFFLPYTIDLFSIRNKLQKAKLKELKELLKTHSSSTDRTAESIPPIKNRTNPEAL